MNNVMAERDIFSSLENDAELKQLKKKIKGTISNINGP